MEWQGPKRCSGCFWYIFYTFINGRRTQSNQENNAITMIRRLRKTTLLFMITIGVISIDACRKNYDATAEDMTEYGWVLYTAEDYLSSNEWFNSSIVENDKWKDGYNGLGWSYAKLMVIDTSIAHFITGLATEEDKWLTTDVQSEILAGLVFAYHAKGLDASVVTYGLSLIHI